jgi:hypothetical protein
VSAGRLGLHDDRGLATVVAAGAIGTVGLLLGALLVLGSAVATRHRAESACTTAREVAGRDGATLVRCTWIGWDLQVDVARTCGCLPVGDLTTVRARAGPVVKVMPRIAEGAVADRHRTVSSPDERPQPPAER